MSLPSRSITPVAPSYIASEWRVPLANIGHSAEEERALLEVFRSDWWTYGPVCRELEKRFAEYLGVRHALAVSSGTAALHAACSVAGISSGDEAITTPITFAATANSVIYCGGKPVFADIRQDTLNIDVKEIEKKLSPKIEKYT